MMKKTKIICLNQFNIIKFIKNNKITLMLSLLFVIGVIVSVVLYKREFLSNKFPIWLTEYYFSIRANSLLISFSKAMLSLSLIVAVFFMCGTSMMGIVTVPISISTLGFVIGSFISHIYSLYDLRGVAYTAVILIPPALLFLASVFNTCKHTIDFSFSITKLTFANSVSKNISVEFKSYCFKYLMLLIFTFLSAILDVILNNSFLKYFEF